jgi:hypothetical protein
LLEGIYRKVYYRLEKPACVVLPAMILGVRRLVGAKTPLRGASAVLSYVKPRTSKLVHSL